MSNVKHSSETVRWGTPGVILDAALQVLDRPFLDPASDADFNKRVKADIFLTEQDNGLTSSWVPDIDVFLNPPGNKLKNKSVAALFWKRLIEHRDRGCLRQAIFLAFSLEQLQTTQNYNTAPMGEFPICIPKKRIAFETPEGTPGKAPSHANCIVYVPGQVNKTDLFFSVFQDLGTVIIPR